MSMLTYLRPGPVPQRHDDGSTHTYRQTIGYIGLLLPVAMIALVKARDGEVVWVKLTSISAYYYTGAVVAFAGMLVALSLFLFTYKGYNNGPENKPHWADRWCGVAAGVAALLVAFFPTKAPQGIEPLKWWEPWMGYVHHGSAIVLFGVFAVFCLWLFRKTAEGEKETPPDKKWRNGIYAICGLAIILCMIWAGINARSDESIFWPETWALVAFSTSWLVKGYALRSIVNVVGSTPKVARAWLWTGVTGHK